MISFSLFISFSLLPLLQCRIRDLKTFFSHLPLSIEVFTASSQRERILRESQQGKINILVGTHALLNEELRFKNLGLIVIDEQHRFGVAQKALLLKKASRPDVLVMSATPIPRSLALTIYGDLDISFIRELPPGRKTPQGRSAKRSPPPTPASRAYPSFSTKRRGGAPRLVLRSFGQPPRGLLLRSNDPQLNDIQHLAVACAAVIAAHRSPAPIHSSRCP
jgi:hypothetical protein